MRIDLRQKIALLLLVFVGLGSMATWVTIRVTGSEPVIHERNQDARPYVNVGVISRYTPRTLVAGYQPFLDYLSSVTPYRFRLRLSRNYLETVNQLVNGDIDFASLGNYTYIQALKQHDLKCIAIPLNPEGSIEIYDAIIVADESPIHSIADLEGKRMAFASKQSMSVWMGRWMLWNAGLSLEDLSSYSYLNHHDLVAEKVLSGEYDAGVVKNMVAEGFKASGIRILTASPTFPGVPFVARPGLDSSMVSDVQHALLALPELIRQQKIDTSTWDGELAYGFIAGDDSLYNLPRQIIAQVQKQTSH